MYVWECVEMGPQPKYQGDLSGDLSARERSLWAFIKETQLCCRLGNLFMKYGCTGQTFAPCAVTGPRWHSLHLPSSIPHLFVKQGTTGHVTVHMTCYPKRLRSPSHGFQPQMYL